MGMREKLIEILSVPIYPHELADPTEVVADYLLDNGVVPVVRCKDCKHYGWEQEPCHGRTQRFCKLHKGLVVVYKDTFCSYGERRTDERETG